MRIKIADCVYIAAERSLKKGNIFIVCNFIALSFFFVGVFFVIIGVYIPASETKGVELLQLDSPRKVSEENEVDFYQTIYKLPLEGLLKRILLSYMLFIA